MTTRRHCTSDIYSHPLTDQLAAARDRLRQASVTTSGSPLVGPDLYWALGVLAQCLTATNEFIEHVGVNASGQLTSGTSVVESGPFTGAPDTALLSAVLALATASSHCSPVIDAVTDAQIAVADLAATPVHR
ncbi:hypothetical protein QMK17_24495 [Rhodococcus sp. G-MC3]|uniref:hypothetical protein n=1 Tax=Rhodococcus sp. G-MC3 TaxID=3046209 RepID=UPI0024BBAA3B|nr:hypothetical protein [Rhodococcus sp. G-MC3]MDJ0396467.1 hypothetical protein [Rhodococcus sp. G-MC3]